MTSSSVTAPMACAAAAAADIPIFNKDVLPITLFEKAQIVKPAIGMSEF